MTTVTHLATREVLLVLDWPAGIKPADVDPSRLWLLNAAGKRRSGRVSDFTPGGEFRGLA